MRYRNIARASVVAGLVLVSVGLNGCGRMGAAQPPASAALAAPGPLGTPDTGSTASTINPLPATASASVRATTVLKRVVIKRVTIRKTRIARNGVRRTVVRRVVVRRTVVRRTVLTASAAAATADLKGNLDTSLLPPPPALAKAPGEETEPGVVTAADPAQTATAAPVAPTQPATT